MNELPRLHQQPAETLMPAIRIALLAIVELALFLGAGLFFLSRYDMFGRHHLSNHFALTQDLTAATLISAALLPALLIRPYGPVMPALELSRVRLLLLAGFAALLCYAGTYIVFAGYPLSMDEFLATFDAEILRHGLLGAPLAGEWREFSQALQPVFMIQAEAGGIWSSAYLPGNAAIRTLFAGLGDQAFAGPALAAFSLVTLYGIARTLDPEDRGLAAIAVLLLGTSAQFLITAMTPYAMTAHLALNLAWLWLVLRRRPWAHIIAVPVTFLATGLHQAIFHPLFVAPFLVILWQSGRRRAAVGYALWAGASALFWVSYWSIAFDAVQFADGQSGAGNLVERLLALMGHALQPSSLTSMLANLLRLFTWQNPLLLVLLAAALLTVRRQPPIVTALLGGAALTLAALILLMPYQGHGWGYRYLHGFLGSFALAAAYGWRSLVRTNPEITGGLRTLLWLSIAFSLAVLLPLRAWQAYAFSRPYAEAQAAIARSTADVVIIENAGRYYAEDLVRNDPFLRNRPLIMRADRLAPGQMRTLCGRYEAEIVAASSPQLAGLRTLHHRGARAGVRRLAMLRQAGCGLPR